MTDSGSARRDEWNDMCFEAGRRFIPEIASAHVHCDEIHIIRFVSTSRTRIRQLRIDWLRPVRDIAVFLLRMRTLTAIAQLRMRRRKRRYLVEIPTNLCADDRFWFSSSRRIE